jgi:dethiobiotin synthase
MERVKKIRKFTEKIFVTGTDTVIGKTLLSAILLSGLECRYWKPVQSGMEEMTDTQWVMEKAGLEASRFMPETYRLQRPLSPHASTEAEGMRIELDRLRAYP